MKVLLINGSPKPAGCTYTALKEVEKALNEEGIETILYQVGSKYVRGCIGCGGCRKVGKCVFDDDTLNGAAELMKECDGIVVGSPVHYAAASGAITGFMDRLFYSAGKYCAYKPGAAIVSCRRGGATAAIDQLQKYFTISNMPIVSSNYWSMVHGNTPAEVLQDEEGLQTMRLVGKNMAWLLKCIEAGKAQGIEPKKEAKISTNFIR
ncbi:MAG: flavodoxin family protein [Lachnospiraceae bacterium]